MVNFTDVAYGKSVTRKLQILNFKGEVIVIFMITVPNWNLVARIICSEKLENKFLLHHQ
jgi:hypothetical protein